MKIGNKFNRFLKWLLITQITIATLAPLTLSATGNKDNESKPKEVYVYRGKEYNSLEDFSSLASPEKLRPGSAIDDLQEALDKIASELDKEFIGPMPSDSDSDESSGDPEFIGPMPGGGDSEGGGSSVSRSPTTYPEDYDYEEALQDSYIASQFARPLGSSLYTVLLDESMKAGAKGMYSEETGQAVNINYRDVYYYDSNKKKQQAKVYELFDMQPDGEGREFFIEYWYETTDEEGEVVIEYEDERVFYTNPYSHFYLTLALSDSGARTDILEGNKTQAVQMDQYGNIVVSSNNNLNHAMIIPNFANPELNTNKEFFLPSRLFLTKYDTGNIQTALKWSNEKGWTTKVKSSTFKSQVGDALNPNAITMYDVAGSTRVVNRDGISSLGLKGSIMSILDDKLTHTKQVFTDLPGLSDAYEKYLGAHDGKYEAMENTESVAFVFGNKHDKYMMNKYQTETKTYKALGEIGTNGFGKTNSSFMYLPKKYLNMGEGTLGFEQYNIEISEAGFETGGTWSVYMHQAANKGLKMFNQGVVWGDEADLKEINLVSSMVQSFASSVDSEKMERIAYYSEDTDDRTDNPIFEELGDIGVEQTTQKTNSIIDIMHFMLNNIGSSTVAMQTSKMSITYKNIIHNLEENYLFHVSNIIESEALSRMIRFYMQGVIFLNILWFIYWSFKLYSGNEGSFIEVMKKIMLVVVLSALPLITLIYYTVATESYTEKIFNETFVYWSLVDLDIVNRQSYDDQRYTVNEMEFFRESGVVPHDSHGSIEVYGLSGVPKETNSEMEFIKAVATAQNTDSSTKPLTSEITTITLSDGLVRGVPTGSDLEAIMANTHEYDTSILYYFYDTFRYHYYNYYKDTIDNSSDHDFYEDRGMVRSLNTFRSMITNPYFLYGGDFDIEDTDTIEVQDVLGLTNLFSTEDVGGRPGYYDEIEYSPWLELMRSNSNNVERIKDGNNLLDMTDPNNYSSGTILATVDKTDLDREYTDFEELLQKVNSKTVVRLQTLNDYSMYTDESLMFMAALISTMEFNREMNRALKPTTKLVPTTFNSQSYSLDTIFSSMFLDNMNREQTYRGDLMWAVEEQGGIVVQAIIIVTAFIGQLSGLLNVVSVIMLFVTASLVFLFAYSLSRNLFNEAWIGLASLFGVLLVIHMVFILLIYWVCVPATSVIQASIFKGYSNGIRTLLILIFLILRSLAVGAVLFFLAKNYKDLGGRIIAENISGVVDNLTGTFSNRGNLAATAGLAHLATDSVNMDTGTSSSASDVNINEGSVDASSAREEAEVAVKGENLSDDKEVSEEKIGRQEVEEFNNDSSEVLESEKGGTAETISQNDEKELVTDTSSSAITSEDTSTNTSEKDTSSEGEQVNNNESSSRSDKESSSLKESSEKDRSESKEKKENERVLGTENEEREIINNNRTRDIDNNTHTDTRVNTSDTTDTKETSKDKTKGKGKDGEGKPQEEMSEMEKIFQELNGVLETPDSGADDSTAGGGIFSREKKSDER